MLRSYNHTLHDELHFKNWDRLTTYNSLRLEPADRAWPILYTNLDIIKKYIYDYVIQ